VVLACGVSLHRILALLCSIVVTACDGSTPASDAGFDAGPADVDAGSLDAGMAAVDAGPPASIGRISIGVPGRVLVKFYRDGVYSDPVGLACTIEYEGPCVMLLCDPAAATANVTAGPIHVVGAGGATVDVVPDANGVYTNPNSAWAPGERLTITADGDFVPAFTAEVTVPAQVSVDPVVPPTIVRADGVTITWTARAGDVRVAVTADPGEVACTFDANAGTGTIPGSMLQRLAAGTARVAAFPIAAVRVTPTGNVVDVQAVYADNSTLTTVTLQ
jgi:hypothetical protein